MPKPAYSEREYQRVLEYLENSPPGLEKPLKKLAEDVLLNWFGWPVESGKKRARKIVEAMEERKIIECAHSGKTITLITLTRTKLEPANSIPDNADGNEEVRLPQRTKFVQISRQYRPVIAGKKGAAKEARRKAEYGEENEIFLYDCARKLVELLKTHFADIVVFGDCSRSGRHNPKKGKIDLQDHWGEDVLIQFTVRCKNNFLYSGSIIYDAKSSRRDAEEFNRDIRIYPGQEYALLKRAIWSSKKYLSEKKLAEEMLHDMVSVGLLPLDFDKEKVLNLL